MDSRRRFLFATLGFLAATGTASAGKFARRLPLRRGLSRRILFTDSEAAVLALDPDSGEAQPYSVGNYLIRPYGITAGERQSCYVSDTGALAIIHLDNRGRQRVVTAGGAFGIPFGLAYRRGTLLVADARNIVEVNCFNGAQRVAVSGGLLQTPIDVAAGRGMILYVADAIGRIIEANSATGQQRLVTEGGHLRRPMGICYARNGLLLVADPGASAVIIVDPITGRQRILCAGQPLRSPTGITCDAHGHMFVADPDCADFAGGIMLLSPNTSPHALFTGTGDFVNPRSLLVLE